MHRKVFRNGGPLLQILNRLLDLKLFLASLHAVPCLMSHSMVAGTEVKIIRVSGGYT